MTFDTPSSASFDGSAAWNSVGNAIEPTPTIRPWPGIKRGTDCRVPIVPGFVRLTVVPAKSSTPSLPSRAFTMRSW